MATSNEGDQEHAPGRLGMNTPPIVSPEAWEAARQRWWNWHDNYDAETSPDPKIGGWRRLSSRR